MGKVVKAKFPCDPPRPRRPDSVVITLPVIRIEPYADWPEPKKPRAPKAGRRARAALQDLRGHVRSASCALAYLKALAREWPDPRAVAALLDETDLLLIGNPEETHAGLAWLLEFLGAKREAGRGETGEK
jgi:hypothetical protein